MVISFDFVLDLHLPYFYVALLHNLCSLQSIVPSLPVWVMASPIFCGVLKQCRFYKVGFIALCPTPNNPGCRVVSSSGFSPPTCLLVWIGGSLKPCHHLLISCKHKALSTCEILGSNGDKYQYYISLGCGCTQFGISFPLSQWSLLLASSPLLPLR